MNAIASTEAELLNGQEAARMTVVVLQRIVSMTRTPEDLVDVGQALASIAAAVRRLGI